MLGAALDTWDLRSDIGPTSAGTALSGMLQQHHAAGATCSVKKRAHTRVSNRAEVLLEDKKSSTVVKGKK